MKRRTRYFLISLGIVFFFIVAPLIVFYVRGVRYNFTTNKYQSTGILAINTDPKNAELLQDGKAIATTPANVRFIPEGEYTLTVQKEGYRSWSKRLPVWEAKVTWIHSGDALYLLKNDVSAQDLAHEAIDFTVKDKTLYYLTSDSLVTTSVEPNSQVASAKIPHPASTLELSPNGHWLLLQNSDYTTLYNVGAKSFSDLNSALGPSPYKLAFSGDALLFLSEGNLMQIDLKSLKKSTLLKNISTFTTLADQIYYATSDGISNSIKIATISKPDSATVILDHLPVFTDADLIITEQKQLMLLADQTLYRVNSQLDRVSNGITEWYFDSVTQELTYTSLSESYYYDFLDSSAHLIIRSGNLVTQPRANLTIGYSFFFQNKQLVALETDTRDHQNSYILIDVAESGKLELSPDNKHIYILDGQTVKSLTIR